MSFLKKFSIFSILALSVIVPIIVWAQTWQLNYSADNGGNISGTTEQFVEEGQYGSEVTANPDYCYNFTTWSDSNTSRTRTDGPIYSDSSFIAYFEQDQSTYAATYEASTGGTISGDSNQSLSCGNMTSTVTAVPDEGYIFSNWTPDLNNSPTRSDLVSQYSFTHTANFIRQYTLTYTGDETCLISGTTPQTVIEGQSGSMVEAQPAEGYYFVQWSDGLLTAQRTDSGDGDFNVTATCSPLNEYTVTYNAGDDGYIEGTTPQTVIQGGDTISVTPMPNSGYRFVKWSDNSTANPRTDVDVAEDITVTAFFAPFPTDIIVSKSSVSVTEGGLNDTYTIVLNGLPRNTVTVNFSTTNQATTSVSSINFTGDNWDVPQTITVSAINDSIDEDTHYATTTFSVVSTDSDFDDFSIEDMGITITDNDTAGFTKSKSSINITEGSNDTFTLVLNSQPASDVVIGVVSNDASVSVNASEFTFTNSNWNTPQTVTISAQSDADYDNETANITISIIDEDSDNQFDSLVDQTITVNVTDDDTLEESGDDEEDATEEISEETTSENRPGSKRRSVSSGETFVENQVNSIDSSISNETPEEKIEKCDPYLNDLISKNKSSSQEDVINLQKFLNSYLSLELEINGIYNEETIEAVKNFKLLNLSKYNQDIKESEEEVGFITKNLINSIVCSQSKNTNCPYFSKLEYAKAGDSGEKVTKIKKFLNTIEGEILDIKNTVFDNSLVEAVKRFQIKYYESILKPWGLVNPTGVWYQSTTKKANDLIGCFDAIKIDNGEIVY